MGGVVAVVAAQRARATRELVAHLREQKAFSPTTAALLRPQRRLGQRALQDLIDASAIVRSGADRYWLDETAYAAMQAGRMRRAGMLVAVALVVAVTFALLIPMLMGR